MSNENDFIKKFRVVISNVPDRENCVCEIYYNHIQWAEISKENEEVIIQFYSHPSQKYWEFPLEIAMEILQKAKSLFLVQ